MLFSFKRLKQIVPIILLIMFAVAVSSFKSRVDRTIEEVAESAPWPVNVAVSSFIGDSDGQAEEENEEDKSPSDDREFPDEAIVTISNGEDEHHVTAELATTAGKRALGLMNRDNLCDECGMFFVFDRDDDGGFWMKNCLIPLDIIFISEDGAIVDVKKNFEPCANDPCPSFSPDEQYRYVLEVNGGWVDSHGIEVGDIVKIPFL